MKRSANSPEVAPLNGAAFHIDGEVFRRGKIEVLIEEMLAQVFGGLETGTMDAACTEFTCNVYAPPPPPK
jgi:hypothetical protein